MFSKRASCNLFAISLLVLAVGCRQPLTEDEAATPDGAATPEELTQNVQAASKGEDMAALVRLIHPEDLQYMAFGMLLEASYLAGESDDAEASKKELDALADKYDIKEPESLDSDALDQMAREVFKGVDLKAFMPELFAVLKKYEWSIPIKKLENLKVEGDTATVTVDGEKQRLERIDSRWYLRLSSQPVSAKSS
jgi:hypothetical protein